ncbi:MAG TPA: hypothetical protein VK543_06150, partial [Puia sp.]|nr:hypothetical protein [Puia sp.]
MSTIPNDLIVRQMPNENAASDTVAAVPVLTGEPPDAATPLKFTVLPGYARYLLEEKLDEYTKEELRLSRSMEIPLMKLLVAMPDAAVKEAIFERAAILLRALSLNQASDYIQQSLLSWLSGKTVHISREQVMIEDVVLINVMRRDLFRNFLSGYTNDLKKGLEIMREMDRFTSDMEKRSIVAIFQMQKQLYNHSQSMAQVGNWQWDLLSNKLTWSDEMFRIYDLAPQSSFAGNLASFNHPADQD